ncbi:MAG: phosphatase PAP2-related protein [Deltaproteobacteria bacterium]|nr:phosphatase PAP2-related protein [Deltaproteobacteria bacterium]
MKGARWESIRARIAGSVIAALLWRYACHAVMVALALWNEARPAPALHDLVLDIVPHVQWIAAHNYQLWLAAYAPLAIALWRRDRDIFVRFLWVGGVLSLLRGLCIPLTGLGPTWGPDLNAGLPVSTLFAAWLAIVNPVSALLTDAPHAYLTKDLFFSGHASSTFLLWLYCRKDRVLGPLALAAHALVVAIVFLAHLHYTIDVVGAWAITYCIYMLFEAGHGPSHASHAPQGPGPGSSGSPK